MTTPKEDALWEIIRDARRVFNTNTSAKRILKAAKALGLDAKETVTLFYYLDYCDSGGAPYGKNVKPIWLSEREKDRP
jgi:hypothetical protein